MIEKNTPQNVIPIAATRGLGYTEAEAMLGDLISKDRVSDTAIRVARDHMIQFARKLPNMLPSVDEPENAETCATPLGQSGMTCALQADHGGVCAASPNGNWNEGWISEPPLPVAAFVDPLDNDQFATLLSTLDAKIKASSDDTLELAWLLTLKIEISRLRTENSKLSAKLTQPLEDIETAAIAIAMNRLRHCRPPVRWPAGPEDRLSGRDGTVPITWDAAEQYREDAAVALGAIPEIAINKALADSLQEAIELLDDCEIAHPGRWEAALAMVGRSKLLNNSDPSKEPL